MNIKNKLKSLAEKQEINDLHENIINKVDTSKVLDEPIIVPRRGIRLMPILMGAAALLIVFVIGLSIPFIVNGVNTKPTNGTVPNEPPVVTNPDGTTPDEFDFSSFTIQPQKFLNAMERQETFNIVNVVNTFKNIKFDQVELDTSDKPKMTVSEENELVNDIHNNISNIEYMLGLKGNPLCSPKENDNTSYDYKTLIDVSYDNYSYKMYLTEIVVEQKNIGEVNYKANKDYEGVIVSGNNEYSFNGSLRLTKNAFEYNTTVIIDNNRYVKVYEKFGVKSNEFIYNYYDKSDIDNIKTKTINITQLLNEDGTTKKVSFENLYTDLEYMRHEEGTYINCKIKSRQSDMLSININDDNQYVYQFKNSKNPYIK